MSKELYYYLTDKKDVIKEMAFTKRYRSLPIDKEVGKFLNYRARIQLERDIYIDHCNFKICTVITLDDRKRQDGNHKPMRSFDIFSSSFFEYGVEEREKRFHLFKDDVLETIRKDIADFEKCFDLKELLTTCSSRDRLSSAYYESNFFGEQILEIAAFQLCEKTGFSFKEIANILNKNGVLEAFIDNQESIFDIFKQSNNIEEINDMFELNFMY